MAFTFSLQPFAYLNSVASSLICGLYYVPVPAFNFLKFIYELSVDGEKFGQCQNYKMTI